MSQSGLTWRDWIAAATVFAVLLGSLVPGGVRLVPFDLPDQKHFFAYALMALLLVLARGHRLKRAAAIAAALSAMGLAIELLQSVIPGRSFYWEDVGANALGALVGAAAGWMLRYFFRRAARALGKLG